jgi:hypothetical protein
MTSLPLRNNKEEHMTNQKDQNFVKFSDKEKEFSKSIHNWLAQYDEEDDFLCGKVAKLLPEFTEEE